MFMKNTRIQEEEEIMEMNEFVPFDEWEIASNEDISTNKMPFRLGIEFETGNLLSYEICDLYAYHKEPLFTCTNKEGKKLWHFELDCNDIEIVTVPFSQSQIDDLKECSATINKAFTILKKLVNDEGKKNTLREWFEKLKENGLFLYEEELFKKLENEFIFWKNGTQKWEGFLQPHSTIQMPLEYVVELSFELFKNETGTISIFEASLPFKSRENL